MNLLSFVKSLYLLIKSDLKSQKIKPCDILLICGDNDRSFKWKKKYISPLIDPIRAEINKSGLKTQSLATPLSTVSVQDGAGNPISLNLKYIYSKLCDKIFNEKLKPYKRRKKCFMLSTWKREIQKARPKVILGIQPPEEICAAAKELDVPVFDLQHGIIEPSVFYNKRINSKFKKKGIPDAVLCWDKISESSLKKLWPWVMTIIIGNPWHDHFKKNHPKINALKKLKDKKLKNKTLDPFILITTQWSKKNNKKLNIPKKIVKIFKMLAPLNINVAIKFHPRQIKQIGSKELLFSLNKILNGIGIEKIFDVSNLPLPLLLCHAKLHLTGSSACAIEAGQFGVKTGLWEKSKKVKKWFSPYLKKRTVYFLPEKPSKILAKIKNAVRKK